MRDKFPKPKAAEKPPLLAEIRAIARVSGNIVILDSPRKKGRRRGITRKQIERCCQLGTIEEGPFKNERLEWQVTLVRHAAGERIRCVVIVRDGRLIVRSNH
jgi:hypothetical protein